MIENQNLDELMKAIDQCDVGTQLQLIAICIGLKKSDYADKVSALCRTLAKQSYADAQFLLGMCYENGYGVKRSYAQAVRWYKKVDDTISGAAFEKAWQEEIRRGEPSPEEVVQFERVLKYIEKMEEEKAETSQTDIEEIDTEITSAEKQNELGHQYFWGQGVEKDLQKAIYWSKKAADQGVEASIHRLAECYEQEKNYKESAMWYRLYAKKRIEWRDSYQG